MKSLSKGESAFVLLILACFGVTATALVRDITASGSLRGQKVGTITWKDRYAEQRQEGTGLWVSATKDGPVFNHDTIRTGENSSAVIKLDNKTEISLDEGSMVYIKIDAATERATISLKGGSIKVAQDKKAAPVSLETATGSIAIKDGTVRVSGDQAGMTVRAESSAAQIVSEKSAEPITLDASTDFDVAKREVVPVTLAVTEPARDAVLVTDKKTARVTFAWTPPEERHPLDIALDGAFKKSVRENAAFASADALELPAGHYWWRIPETAERGSFTIVAGGISAPQNPVGKTFIKAADTVSVPFSWAKKGEASSYRVDVYSDKAGDSPIMQRAVMQRSTSIDFADSGNYYWTVTAFYGPDNVPFTSERESFSIVTAALPAPASPEISREIATWQPVDGADRYELKASADAAGSAVRYGTTTTASYASLKKALPDGTWYVSVRAGAGTILSPWSTPTRYELLPPQPIAISSPANGAEASVAAGKVALAWVDKNKGTLYRVTVSRIQDLSNPIAEISAHRTSCSVALPSDKAAGKYFWKVSLLDAQGTVRSESPTASFSVREPLVPPEPLSPTKGAVLDLNTINALHFEWKAAPGAESYELTLSRMTAGIAQSIETWRTNETALTTKDFSRLAFDSFSWSLVAVRKNADGTESKSDAAVSFFKITQGKRLSVPTIKVMKTKGSY
ncbi:MAG TPA: FecR family protein [Treponemataceae bacterium]|nr:FecR family protein [Treponemataceae bacterium]